MTELEQDILHFFATAGGTAPAAPLFAQRARATVYRALAALKARGLLAAEGDGHYALLPAGRDAIEAERRGDPAPAPPPRLPFAALDLMPSAEHRAVAELVVLAAVVRRHRESHHASYVLASGPLRGKSWLLRACCHLLGADPQTSVLHARAESGKSLAARRGAKGQVTSVRDALSSPVLGIDEWLRGEPAVRRASQLLIHGERTVPFENEHLSVMCVVLLALNPRKADALEDRLGLDEALIRRCFVASFDGTALDAAFAKDGEERLDRIREAGRVEVRTPRAAPDFEKDARERIRAALAEILDTEERLGSLDLVLLGQLAWAATGWLGEDDAVRLVVEDACTIYATTGWTQLDWRARLARALADGPRAADVPAQLASEPAEDDEPNPFDFEARLARLAEVCRRLGLDPERAEARLRLVEALDTLGVSAEDVALFVEELRSNGTPPAAAIRAVASLLRAHGRLQVSQQASEARAAEAKERADHEERRLRICHRIVERMSQEPGLSFVLDAAERELFASFMKAALSSSTV